ncbi:MAG: hypothetical protein JXA13_12780 [Anaerolineales bacterium]|nr:hypothetical protein [Anaerolineales bacterium]
MKREIITTIIITIICFAFCVACSPGYAETFTPENITDESLTLPPLSIENSPTPTQAAVVEYTSTPQIFNQTCPGIDDSLVMDLSFDQINSWRNPDHKTMLEILDYLNRGGNPIKLTQALADKKANLLISDVTGDGKSEYILVADIEYSFSDYLGIFQCNNSHYRLTSYPAEGALGIDTGSYIDLKMVRDTNLNRTVDIVISETKDHYVYATILEWNGHEFITLSPNARIWKGYGPNSLTIKNRSEDSMLRFSLRGSGVPDGLDISPYDMEGPSRRQINNFDWDGSNFTLSSIEYDLPRYRFQAIQDGDLYVLYGKFNSAFMSYSMAISDRNLDCWSSEKAQNYAASREASWNSPTPTPVPQDDNETLQLIAYAYYRIMVLHTYRGYQAPAEDTFTLLLELFPENNPGHPYAEMAELFWKEYQASHDMTRACGAAIQYAAEHPEILAPLGSEYHGTQSRYYTPEVICPLR